MSTIAAKKALQHKAGPELIMYWMGGILLLAILVEIVFYWIKSYDFDITTLVPVYYFLFTGGITIGVGSYISANPEKQLAYLKEWLIMLIVSAVLFGLAFGAYMW